mmetsp:Transcript_23912/g.66364  ORF Transcript_23912/g.66364 Transcript_23912/m.66364 type:complete len:138 (-) Transcript_23912:91-504(-)|eukprot:CAMPEP_0117682298 /NCGR_PEP_ID=MMETSP0804-20121206/19568_1 /TAXON_ID=1074897 /ORGANISM="Tetraselmis astigmatica, Strain CCMP880" /LENGTH=137 /DNA_ID=CAMNT_0005492367 /DNA_START=54 /DNA_END=467 /DNA_ORIENTATION=-
METLEVLLRFQSIDTGEVREKPVRVSASQGDTVADLKRRVAAAEKIPEDAAKLVVFNGQRLDDQDHLDKCGLTASDGSEEWANQAIYPNCWFLLAHRKAYVKVVDPLWPPVRPIQQPGDFLWALLLAAFVCGATMLA